MLVSSRATLMVRVYLLSLSLSLSLSLTHSSTLVGWQCAMKELDIENIDDLSLTAFEGEIRLLELLPPHNNIVRYLYHERIEGKLRLYMTKYAGSLGSRLRELRKLVDAGRGTIYSAKAIVKYCLDIAQGIAFLHQHNIVHRDLKSDNIFVMLNERKDIHHLAIADFDTGTSVAQSCIPSWSWSSSSSSYTNFSAYRTTSTTAKQVSKAELAKTCIGYVRIHGGKRLCGC